MLNNGMLEAAIRKSKDLSKIEYEKLQEQNTPAKNRAVICPFDLILGTTNNTEFGERPGNVFVRNAKTYQRIFNGKDNLLLT